MTPAISIGRWIGEWDLLGKLAEWIRASRADHYDDYVAKGQMTENDAALDRLTRAAIAADWTAIASNQPREAGLPDVARAWKVQTIEGALANIERRIGALRAQDMAIDDWIDLRDATAALLHYQRSPSGGPLSWQAGERDRAASQLLEIRDAA